MTLPTELVRSTYGVARSTHKSDGMVISDDPPTNGIESPSRKTSPLYNSPHTTVQLPIQVSRLGDETHFETASRHAHIDKITYTITARRQETALVRPDQPVTEKCYPDYVRTMTVTDSKGCIKELIFPKALDLDRPKRLRTTFTSHQLACLERKFLDNPYLVGKDRSRLARELQLSETQVKVWYQNRRTKRKKDNESQSAHLKSMNCQHSFARNNTEKTISAFRISDFPTYYSLSSADTPHFSYML